MPLLGKDDSEVSQGMTEVVASNATSSKRPSSDSKISLNGDLRAHAAKKIAKDHKQPSVKRAAPQTQKSLSASKRDAIWLTAIAQDRDAKALSALFDVYTPKLKGWLMARGAGGGSSLKGRICREPVLR